MKSPKSPLRWSTLSPCAAGCYWYRASEAHEASIVKVWWDADQWSLIYRDLDIDPESEDASVDFVVNWAQPHVPDAEWARIPEPK